MKKSTVDQNGVSERIVTLIKFLVDLIPWPIRRSAMGYVALAILDGKSRVAEKVFGWGRATVALGINEYRTKILCINDLSQRQRPKAEDKNPRLLADIVEIMTPCSEAESSLRTTIAYTDLTAKAVYRLLLEKGWSEEDLPTERTISNILNRHEYRLRTVAKSKVQKKRQIPMQSSTMSGS